MAERKKVTVKYCEVFEEKYATSIFYYSESWQSVSIYEKIGDGRLRQIFHGTFNIDIHAEPVAYSLDMGVNMMMFVNYATHVVREATKWLEFWDNVEYTDEKYEKIVEELNETATYLTQTSQ